MPDDPLTRLLQSRFGHTSFREGQEEVVRTLLDGRPALAVFPTGGGKSLCYQLPALLLDGLTLVVSPLIALMKDQVDSLVRRGIPAARLDSTLDPEESRGVLARMADGSLKLLFIAPERIANESFRNHLKSTTVALIAIDEAHCISEWGHNFRPDYLKLAAWCRRLRVPRVLALTATATPKVAADIRRTFRIRKPDHIQRSFHRPNLTLSVHPGPDPQRPAELLRILTENPGPAVVYVTRQETAEAVSTRLRSLGLPSRAYHAGLPDDTRSSVQEEFMAGSTRIVVATIAFGMGIDKADIRTVVHYNLPKSLEHYAQETGRAGRDGQPARCFLLACTDDLAPLRNFIHGDTPPPGALTSLVRRILHLGREFDISTHELSVSCDIRPSVIATVMTYLELDGIVEARGSFFSRYLVRPARGTAAILAGRTGRDLAFHRSLLDSATRQRGALVIDAESAASTLGTRRDRVADAVQSWAASGDASVKPAGFRQMFRRKQDPGDIHTLIQQLSTRFLHREQADLARLGDVLALATTRSCLTGHLTRYFGESLASPCGHCDRCLSIPPSPLPPPATIPPTDDEWLVLRQTVAEQHAALASPRQLARFLCGIHSPATFHAKLTRHEAFGLLHRIPFDDVLAIAAAQVPEPR